MVVDVISSFILGIIIDSRQGVCRSTGSLINQIISSFANEKSLLEGIPPIIRSNLFNFAQDRKREYLSIYSNTLFFDEEVISNDVFFLNLNKKQFFLERGQKLLKS